MTTTPTLRQWTRDNAPDEELIYGQGLYRINDEFAYRCAARVFKRSDFEEDKMIHDLIRVPSTHTSKSVKLPVYHVGLGDHFTLWARYNFHDWNVSIRSRHAITVPEYMSINSRDGYLFFQGMNEWQFSVYSPGLNEFSFCVSSSYDLSAVLWAIASQLRGE